MTYRKLFLGILIASTLMLGMVWWFSVTRAFAAVVTPVKGGRSVQCAVYPGMVELTLNYAFYSGAPRFLYTYSDSSDPMFRHRTSYGRTGQFLVRRESHAAEFPSYLIHLPFWLIYLVFVGGVFLVLKRLERRAGSRGKVMGKRDGDSPGI